MASARFGTAADYFRAFQSLLREHVPPKQLAMLREHFHSPDHTTTWKQLADKVGYPNFNTVSLQYGKLAHRVAHQLGLSDPPATPGGTRWWLWVLVDWADEPDASGNTAFVLRPEVVKALERIGWVDRSTPPVGGQLDFYVEYHNYDSIGWLPGQYDTNADDLSNLDTSRAEVSLITTNKRIIWDAVGDVVFMIVGYGVKPKRYVLWSWSQVEGVKERRDGGFDAFGPGRVLCPPALLEGPEFEQFKRQNGNFGLGVQQITNLPYLPRLVSLAERFGGFKAGPRPQEATQGQEAEPDEPPPALPKEVLRAIKERRGQPKFREQLLRAYGRRCAVTDCDAEPALEAAHIRGYAETGEQDVSNGLLLRADVHTLFDLDLVRIEPATLLVALAPVLEGTCYRELRGRKLRVPERPADGPSQEALRERWEVAR